MKSAGRLIVSSGPRGLRLVLVAACLALLAGLLMVAGVGCGGEPSPVTLQLNWLHESEFVGYYVAEAKGFYAGRDLAVTIVEGGPGKPARDQLLNGEATFAVTSFGEQRDMVAAGQPSVAVMAVFQIPPLVIFSLAASGIEEPADLVGKKVGVTTDYWRDILAQTLTAAGVDPAQVETVKVDNEQLQLLCDGQVDAWLGYAQDEPIQAETAGYPVNNIFPADFGIGGYEGLLIVHKDTVAGQAGLVERFVAASYEGWRYALEHPDEAAEILAGWAPEQGLDFHKLAVRAVAPLVDIPQVPVGWIDAARWEQLMGRAYAEGDPGYTMQFSPATP